MAKTRRSKIDVLIEQIGSLSAEEREELRRRLSPEAGARGKGHSIMELKGLGKDFWRSIDVDAYLNEERESWGS